MFLVDKYYNEYNNMLYDTNHIINNYFDYNNNFQHLILYGPSGSNKKFIVDKILENIYGKNEIEVKDIEYTITGYTNINVKVLIKQSKNHLVIEPNSNGFDKYLIQEIIQNYAKSQVLNIIKSKKLFKIIVINKVYNLSYYAQASLRRTMEKYSNICKFILISDQLSTVIEPLRSRCLLIKVSLYSNSDILNILLYISYKEKINIDFKNINNIIVKSENIINHAIWLLEMYKYNVDYNKNYYEL
jgi:replication factor C subunit 3/5